MESYQIRRELYSAGSLYQGYDPAEPASYADCYDGRIYSDFIAEGKRSHDLAVTLPRTLHDHSISGALFRFLDEWSPADVVGVMGGHAMKRSDESAPGWPDGPTPNWTKPSASFPPPRPSANPSGCRPHST